MQDSASPPSFGSNGREFSVTQAHNGHRNKPQLTKVVSIAGTDVANTSTTDDTNTTNATGTDTAGKHNIRMSGAWVCSCVLTLSREVEELTPRGTEEETLVRLFALLWTQCILL